MTGPFGHRRMKSCDCGSFKSWFAAVIVIVCGWVSVGRSHIVGRLDGVVLVLVLVLVTTVDPQAQRPRIVSATATAAAIDVRKRVLDTDFQLPKVRKLKQHR